MVVTSSAFAHSAFKLLLKTPGINKTGRSRKFRALFGISSHLCAIVWNLMESGLSRHAKPVHLLWALLFLKFYATEHVNSVITGADEKTFGKWAWLFVSLIADIQVIKWESRKASGEFGMCRVSVDGTDCRTYEPTPFRPKWYSHKFKGPGVRYEVGVCIETGSVVWTHGAFPCGAYSDVTIFRMALKHALDDNEKVIADGGYNDDDCRNPRKSGRYARFDAIVRARHETVNRRFKQFFVLSHRFSHKFSLHSRCFHAVANLVQLMIQNGEPLFDVFKAY